MTQGNPYRNSRQAPWIQVHKHNAWEEGHAVGKAEQAELVAELLEACKAAAKDVLRVTQHSFTTECQAALYASLEAAIAKATQ